MKFLGGDVNVVSILGNPEKLEFDLHILSVLASVTSQSDAKSKDMFIPQGVFPHSKAGSSKIPPMPFCLAVSNLYCGRLFLRSSQAGHSNTYCSCLPILF